MLENNNGLQRRHDERAEWFLDKIEGIDELLRHIPGVKEEEKEKEEKQKRGRVIKTRKKFAIREAADFLLGDRNQEENLLMLLHDESFMVRVVGCGDEWINFYEYKNRNVYGVKVRETIRESGENHKYMTLQNKSFFEFSGYDVRNVVFGTSVHDGVEMRFIAIRTTKALHVVFENGFISSK